MPIDQILIREINKKRELIRGNPDSFLKRSQRIKRMLEAESDLYSWWIEHPDLRWQLLEPGQKNNERMIRKLARKGKARLREAWAYMAGLSNAEDKDVAEYLTQKTIINVGHLVDPVNTGLRDIRVSLSLQYTPPNPIKVPELIDRLRRDLTQGDLHSVEKAAMVHLYLTGIQPLKSGNKRVARLFQNAILSQEELPPAVVPVGERAAYIDLLEQGLVGWRDKDLQKQRPFFDYVGGKVNTALDNIVRDLRV
ncbi:Fic family protein [Candidatus Woesearchaeota archaeon]|nr:Fic family protein [Candidatus Woesearchaeota archaeon]